MPRTYFPEPSPVARGRAAHLLSILGPGVATNTTLPNRPSGLVTGCLRARDSTLPPEWSALPLRFRIRALEGPRLTSVRDSY